MIVSLICCIILQQIVVADIGLYAGVGIQLEIIPGSTLVLNVGDLVPGRSYEARISHSAVYPAEFHVHVPKTGRRLLDVDKAVFVATEPNSYLKITTRFHGVSPEANFAQRPIPFDLIVVELRFGVVPADVVGLIAFVIALVTVVLLFIVPPVHQAYFGSVTKGLHQL